MTLTTIQKKFYTTLQNETYRRSCLFDIPLEEAVKVLFDREIFQNKNCNQTIQNVLGWLKFQENHGDYDHEKILGIVSDIFGTHMMETFDNQYLGVDGMTPEDFLFHSIEKLNLDDVKFVLENYIMDPNEPRMRDGKTPLTLACQYGDPLIVRALLEDPRVDPNKFDQGFVHFPLFCAVNENHVEVVKELLKHPNLDPNQTIQMGYGVVINCIFLGHDEILDLLSQDPRVNLHTVRKAQQDTPLQNVVTHGSSEVRKMGEKIYRINPKKEDSQLVTWKTFAFLPVSNDKHHCPPDDFFNGITIVDINSFRNDKYGELEVEHRNALTRVIYKTADYITISVIRKNHPLGPTIYRPSYAMTAEIIDSPNIWHIANQAITDDPRVLHEIISDLAEKKLILLRSLNSDNDQKRILQNSGLRGRGSSTIVAKQVSGEDTSLISVSYQPISRFLNGHKRKHKPIKNGGYVAIFTEKGAKFFIDFQGLYPRLLSHGEVLEEVSHDRNLTQRAKNAKECIFYPDVPLDIVILFDNGYPINQSKKIKNKENTKPLPRKVQKLLVKYKVTYETLPDEAQAMLHGPKNIKTKERLLKEFIE